MRSSRGNEELLSPTRGPISTERETFIQIIAFITFIAFIAFIGAFIAFIAFIGVRVYIYRRARLYIGAHVHIIIAFIAFAGTYI